MRHEDNIFEIEKIEKLKKSPMTYAVTFRNLNDTQFLQDWEKAWTGAHLLNEMLDNGVAKIISY